MAQTGIMLVHGLMGSPKEYLPLEHVLQAAGYNTHAITLPGHGPDPKRPFVNVSTDEILEHVLEEYQTFSRNHDSMMIIGHSLGGIVTLLTAAETPEKLAGIVALSTPYEHAYWVNRTFDLLTVPIHIWLPGLKYLSDSMTGFERPTYAPWMFPKLLTQSRLMFDYLQERVPKIIVPVCLAHSRYDLSIPFPEMEKLAKAMPQSKEVTTHILDRCGHQIFPISNERERTIKVILDFLNQHCPVLDLNTK